MNSRSLNVFIVAILWPFIALCIVSIILERSCGEGAMIFFGPRLAALSFLRYCRMDSDNKPARLAIQWGRGELAAASITSSTMFFPPGTDPLKTSIWILLLLWMFFSSWKTTRVMGDFFKSPPGFQG